VRGTAAKNVGVSSPVQQERDTDSGQFILHVRARTGTRIEETARVADLVEAAIRREIPAAEVDAILDNIGLPYSSINWMHSSSGFIGAADADIILVSLKPDHRPTPTTSGPFGGSCPASFPGRPSTSCPPTSSPRSSTSVCRRRSTFTSPARTSKAIGASPTRC
jgi:hypothetical protein